MDQLRRWWRRLVSCRPWLSARCRALIQRGLDRLPGRRPLNRPDPDPRAAFLRAQVRAEERFHVTASEEHRLGSLTPPLGGPPPADSQPAGQPPQEPERTVPTRTPPGRRR
ncbi:MAG: hypothetical protein JO112_01045 [Planctomycetes bacterium]|nr:hypothetical protein [Planctomycetota bacterium]